MTMKTGARILALSALSAVLFSASAMAKIEEGKLVIWINGDKGCLLYTSPSPRDGLLSRMPSSA